MAGPLARDVYLQVIREALEGVVETKIATEALFEALADYEPDELSDSDALNTMVTLHLHAALQKRVGASSAGAAIEHVSGQLSAILARPAAAADGDRPTLEWEMHSTLEIMRGTGPVQLVVCAAGPRLAKHLMAAVGPTRVTTATVRNAYETKIVVDGMEPEIFVFDGANLPDDEPAALATAVKSASSNMWIVVWSTDMPEERALLAAFEQQNVPATSFDREEGIGPLIDLIRSRGRQSIV